MLTVVNGRSWSIWRVVLKCKPCCTREVLVPSKPPPKHRRRNGYAAERDQGRYERGLEMTEKTAAAAAVAPVPPTKLEPDAIGVAQDTVIGMASSAPAASVGLTLAALAAAAAYGSLAVIILTAIPMLII